MGSTLSLAPHTAAPATTRISEINEAWRLEEDRTPLAHRDWFAGNIDIRTATDRLRPLPAGTFLVRTRGPEFGGRDYALDLKSRGGVKHMKIFWENGRFSFSPARSFDSLVSLINYYRTNELLENFGYKDMEGIKLSTPYKSA